MLAAMKTLPSSLRAVAVVLVGFGCGGAPTAPARQPEVSVTAPRKAPAVDVSRVPEPPSVIIRGRVKNLDALTGVVRAWTKLPIPSGTELFRSLDGMRETGLHGDELAEIASASEPIDVAVILDASKLRPRIALSVAVKSFDAASGRLSVHHKLTESLNGTLSIQPNEEKPVGVDAEPDDEDEDRDHCVLAHAVQGAKLVCGHTDAVDALAPYMARTLPLEPWPSDVHLEFRPSPLRGAIEGLRAQLLGFASRSVAASKGAKRDLAQGLLGSALDALGETNTVSIDASITASGLELATRLEADTDASLITKLLTSGSNEAAPASFWKLPSDVDSAYFRQGSNAKWLEQPLELLTQALIEEAEDEGLPETERKAAVAPLRAFATELVSKARVYGHGLDSAALREATQKLSEVDLNDDTARIAAKRAALGQAIGWHLVQLDTPHGSVSSNLASLARVWNRPGFSKWISAHVSRSELPQIKAQSPSKSLGLPKEAMELAIVLPAETALRAKPTPKGKTNAALKKPTILYVVAVPEGATTWLAVGFDEPTLARKLTSVLGAGGAGGASLAQVKGLESLHGNTLNVGGFSTLHGLLSLTAIDEGRRALWPRLLTAPHHGSVPVFVTYELEPRDGKPARALSRVRIPREAIDDIVSLALRLN
jgi:hypothetical protein